MGFLLSKNEIRSNPCDVDAGSKAGILNYEYNYFGYILILNLILNLYTIDS